jgi:broad specificity polyphosphatase/5'/3'-nucleotidase SurE
VEDEGGFHVKGSNYTNDLSQDSTVEAIRESCSFGITSLAGSLMQPQTAAAAGNKIPIVLPQVQVFTSIRVTSTSWKWDG